jgi:tetratricopeptide (TPR) repeat protein/tRNA A-37 threonylcarbamoyl transferase component Bud32
VQVVGDRYELGDELGRGGMGAVYRGRDKLLDRAVAVKLLTKAMLGSEGQASLLNEAQAIAKLNHPNIVSVFDAGMHEDAPYIVMELVQGTSIHEAKPTDFKSIVAAARQICEALHHAHSHKIVHRDLKPENVLVEPDGTLKLVDFGIARPVASRMTEAGGIIGTVYYLAPESAQAKDIDERVDLYSLGVMLYELTAGELPFEADDPLAVISQHLNASVVPPRAKNPDIPVLLEDLILQLLSKIPEDRPASAAAVMARLAEADILLHEAVTERESGVLDRIARGRFVGRLEELSLAKSQWKQTMTGSGQVLLISGEPGVGKTRFIREIRTFVEISGGLVMTGTADVERAAPYAPFTEMLYGVLSHAESDVPESVLADVIQLAPDLRTQYPEITPKPALDPEAEQQRLFESMVSFCEWISKTTPLLIVLDDAQWADSGSLKLLRHLARRTRQSRVQLAVVYRDVEAEISPILEQVLQDLITDGQPTRLNLRRFEQDDAQAQLEAIFGDRISSELSAAIYGETEGNPFFIEEICKNLVEEGKVEFEDGQWDAQDTGLLDLPGSVRQAVHNRLAKLSKDVQAVIQMAAILGRQFDIPALEASKLKDSNTLVESLDAAQRAQLIEKAGDQSFYFAHGLIPATLVDDLPELRRRRLHNRAAMALEVIRPQDFESLARHYQEAGDAGHAYINYTKAAGRASEAFANQESISYFRTALEMADSHAYLRARDRAYVYGQLADVLSSTNRYGEALEELQKGIGFVSSTQMADEARLVLSELLQRKGQVLRIEGQYDESIESIRNGLDAIPDGYFGERGALKIALASVMARQGELAEAQQWCEEGMDDVKAGGNRPELAHAYSLLGTIRRDRGDTQASLSHRRKSLEISEELDDIPLQIEAHNNIAVAHYDLGQMEEAIQHYQKSRDLSQQVGNLNTTARAQFNLGEVKLIRGELDEAQRAFEEALEIWDRTGWRLGQGYGAADMGAVLIRRGRPADALEQLAIGEKIFSEIGMRVFLPMVYRLQAEAHLALEDLEAAEELANRALELSRELSAAQEEGSALRVLGSIRRSSHAYDQAKAALTRSVDIFQKAGIQYEEALSLYELARLWYDVDDLDSAQTALERAKELFAEVGATYYLNLAQFLQQNLST